jgi:predicted SAM-dependent methyltransferase
MKEYLNLGCGKRTHHEWTNVDFVATTPDVVAANLTEGVPFADGSFDAVYHSHVLEHFSKKQAPAFLQECFRVLRPQGVLRIAVPDLEQIVRSYIFALEQAASGSLEAAANYDWLMLELFDQTVREYPGGNMAAYLFQENILNESFILKRSGTEAKKLIEAGHSQKYLASPPPHWLKDILRSVRQLVIDPSYRQDAILKLFLGSSDYRSLQIGRFRQGGEIHQWMYDRFSLTHGLQQCGFKEATQRTAHESFIDNWISFHLDTEPDGAIYKPDSIYFEAIKPST